MSKELEAKAEDIVKFLYEVWGVSSGMCEQIETKLQRLEAIDNSNPSEALMSLHWMGEHRIEFSEFLTPIKDISEYDTIKNCLLKAQEKHLKDKAFELIILKNVDVNEIRPNATAKAYNSKIPYYRQNLTDDEFRFLKEMVNRLDCEEILFELPKEY